MERTAKIDYRALLSRTVCPRCIFYNDCYIDHDCKALEILVKINEDLDSGNPND